MKLPRQVDPRRPSQAPYNFVPLPDKVYEPTEALPDHSRFEHDRYSGFVDIRLDTETWLYTRAAVSPAYARQHPEMNEDIWREGSEYREFFHHGNREVPVIPGSSLRGMFRQLVEILSDSRLTTASDRPVVYRAVGDRTRFGWTYRRRFIGPNLEPGQAPDSQKFPQKVEYPVRVPEATDPLKHYSVHGGYLFRRGRQWWIQPAQRWPRGSEESFVRVDASQLPRELQPWQEHLGEHPVWVVPSPSADHPRTKRDGTLTLIYSQTELPISLRLPDSGPPHPDAVPAALVVTAGLPGGDSQKHLHCAIFEPDTGAEPKPVLPELQKLYLHDVQAPRAKDREGRILARSANELQENRLVPCFYMLDTGGELVFLGGTLFFRLPYQRSPRDFVPSTAKDDLARRLFGGLMADGPRKGRLRFEDLLWKDEGGGSPFITPRHQSYRSPQQLLEPKSACIQHYLVQPQGVVPEDRYRDNLRHYDDPPFDPEEPDKEGATTLRGFKQYWHRKDQASAACLEPVEAPRNQYKTRTVLRPVRDGVRFEGRVRFDNLSLEELGSLLVAVDLQPSLRHKLGMGRPLGFGSVKISCGGLFLFDAVMRYETFFGAGTGECDSRAPALNAGWRSNAGEVAERAVLAFTRCMIEHRGASLPAGSSKKEALDRFWASPRMIELAALLEWEKAPPPGKTEQRRVPHEQWTHRMILPPPHAVMGWPDPWPKAEAGPSPNAQGEVRRDAGPAATETATELWPAALLTHDRGGGGVLRAASGALRAEARQSDAAVLLEKLSEGSRGRLGKGRTVLAEVVVGRLGAAWRLLEVRETK